MKRFKLVRSMDEVFALSETVTPITNVDELLRRPQIAALDTDDIDATHTFTVPVGKRWLFRAISSYRVEAGGIIHYMRNELGAGYDIRLGSNSSANVLNEFITPVIMDAGWSVRAVYGEGVSGPISTRILFEEEDAY